MSSARLFLLKMRYTSGAPTIKSGYGTNEWYSCKPKEIIGIIVVHFSKENVLIYYITDGRKKLKKKKKKKEKKGRKFTSDE